MANEPELWDPFRQMRRVRRRMFEMFPTPDFFGDIRQPLVDVIDKGKTLHVAAELPGMDKKDIDINVEETSIEIKAKAKQETKKEKKKEGYYFHERSYQSFYRRIPLPAEVNAKSAKAEFKNGILTVELPKKKAKKSKGHRIEVK